MSKEHKLYLGKCDWNHRGRKNCKAYITWKFEDGKFSMCAEVWNPSETDLYCAGQCVDEVAKMFPFNNKARRMVAIWEEWHLNDMVAGSPAQREELAKHTFPNSGEDHYTWALRILGEAGLQPDPSYLHEGNPYSYGSAWLKREIPAEVVTEINSWSLPVLELVGA